MEKFDIEYICKAIGNLSGIPIRLFEKGEQTYFSSVVSLPKDPFVLYKEEILSAKSSIGYFVAPYFCYYGFINFGSSSLVIGPTKQTKHNEKDLRELAFELELDKEKTDKFLSSMKSIVNMPLDSLMQMLCVVNYILNNEKKNLMDISIIESKQESLKKETEEKKIESSYDSFISSSEQNGLHNTFDLEGTIMKFVQNGNVEALKNWLKNAPGIRGGILANNQLRQLKNTFVVSATLASRAAIRGGLEIDEAFSLSDAYIQQCELLSSVEDISNLQYKMIVDFTDKVSRIRLGKSPSPFVLSVSNYIQRHLSENITTETISKHLYISRSRLSTKFKNETGMKLKDFIMQEKVEEAKRLLKYSDKQLITISSYLGFSSQSHFSRIFKSYVKMSPNEYRQASQY